jgi:hypothetical protein
LELLRREQREEQIDEQSERDDAADEIERRHVQLLRSGEQGGSKALAQADEPDCQRTEREGESEVGDIHDAESLDRDL